MQEKNFYLSAVQLAVARLVHHPLAQFGMTWVATKYNLLSAINPLLAVTNFVHYVVASPLMQIKRLGSEEIRETGHGTNSYVAGTWVGLGSTVVGSVPLIICAFVLDNNDGTKLFFITSCLNLAVEINNAVDRQALSEIDAEGYSALSTVMGTAASFGISLGFVPLLGRVGFPLSAAIGNGITNILNKVRLVCSPVFAGKIDPEIVKSNIKYLLGDGVVNAANTAISMVPVPVLSWRVAKYNSASSSVLAVAYSSWNVTDSIARGFMNATGRRLRRDKSEQEKKSIANRGVACVSSISGLFSLFFIVFAKNIVNLFTENPAVLNQTNLMRIIVAAEMFVPIRDSQANALRLGWDDNYFSAIVSVLTTALFLTTCFVSPFGKSDQNDSLSFLSCMGISAALMAIKYFWKLSQRPQCCFWGNNRVTREGEATELTSLVQKTGGPTV